MTCISMHYITHATCCFNQLFFTVLQLFTVKLFWLFKGKIGESLQNGFNHSKIDPR